ncbi:hypothetical protein G9C98_005388 [Cotesia typhae]|uniref:Uncharacterized protein n=1 Tax=Cotesia typhae TaxID=2053667 RepID=A0A8J5QYW3_9HYME|nr:hypothetical protein G9C98_005388 [Cotesia typhae]
MKLVRHLAAKRHLYIPDRIVRKKMLWKQRVPRLDPLRAPGSRKIRRTVWRNNFRSVSASSASSDCYKYSGPYSESS